MVRESGIFSYHLRTCLKYNKYTKIAAKVKLGQKSLSGHILMIWCCVNESMYNIDNTKELSVLVKVLAIDIVLNTTSFFPSKA